MPKVQHIEHSGVSSARRRSMMRVGTSLSEINVVPLVDIMLVLLIIFMVTAPMMQRGLNVNLPQARRAETISSERLFVTVPLSFRTDGVVQLGDEPVRVDVLGERIRQEMEVRSDKAVFIRGDGEITYQELVQVMDQLKQGGVQQVGMVTDFPRERRR